MFNSQSSMFKDYLTALLAIIILAACTTPAQHRRAQFTRVLDHAQEQNLAYDSITNVDSIRMAVDYFNRHGSANEQMRAWYLMGCAYRDMGDAPRAVESYHKSIASADTVSKDCDYRQLYKVYGQLAELLYMQNMPNHVISTYRKVYDYAMLVGDTIPAYLALYHQADAYDLTGDTDSVSYICKNAYKLFEGIGRKDLAASTLFMLVFAELGKDDFESAGKHIAEYEECSGIKEHKENYWNDGMLLYAKGLCALGNKNPALAERCFREELLVSDDVDNKHAGFDGLRKVFQAIHQPDSTAKYAVLSMEFNDSVFHEMNTKHLQQMEAAYNYERHKEEAVIMRMKAEQSNRNILILLFFIVFLIIISALLILYQHRHKKEELKRLQLTIDNDLLRLEQAQADLRQMVEEHEEYGMAIKEKTRTIKTLQRRIAKMNEKVELSKKTSIEERLTNSEVYTRFRMIANKPTEKPALDDWRNLHTLFNKEYPSFYTTLNKSSQMSQFEYDMCLLIRLHFKPAEIAFLLNCDRSTVTVTRTRMLSKYVGKEGKAKDLDDYLFKIV